MRVSRQRASQADTQIYSAEMHLSKLHAATQLYCKQVKMRAPLRRTDPLPVAEERRGSLESTVAVFKDWFVQRRQNKCAIASQLCLQEVLRVPRK